MIASMMMYARAELKDPHDRFWDALRQRLQDAGIDAPDVLNNELPPMQTWSDPQMVFSQTCGMPYRRFLHPQVSLVGTPDYGVEGCPPGYYRSAIVVRADDPGAELCAFKNSRFAYNETGSQSGFAAPHALARAQMFWFAQRAQSHGHVHSARMVAQGEADIAALDAVSWRLMQRYDRFAENLRVLCWTGPTPGLPYITALHQHRDAIASATAATIAALSPKDREDLCIKALVAIPAEDYLKIPNPPAQDS